MNKAKHIWIVNQYSGSRIHGMEFRHYYLAKEFISLGHQVTIISGSYSHLYKTQPTIDGNFTFEEIDGINYCWVKTSNYEKSVSLKRILNMLFFMRMLFRLPHDKLRKPDAIIVSSPSLFPIVNGNAWKKKYSAKLFFEIRDIWPLTLKELGNLSSFHPLILFMRWFEKLGYRKADKVVSLLPNAADHFVSSGMDKSKFVCIPNGISLSEMQQSEPLSENVKALLPKNKFTIGYVGTLGIANGLEYFIDAAAMLKENNEIHFLIVGQGSEKENLELKARGLNNISFIDVIPKLQVQDLISHLDVCYIGLKKEPLFRFGVSPNKLFDYMYSAKPIIYAIDSGNKPVDEAKCGISIESANPKALMEAILRLKEIAVEQRKLIGENGKKYVLENHAYAGLAKKYENLFN